MELGLPGTSPSSLGARGGDAFRREGPEGKLGPRWMGEGAVSRDRREGAMIVDNAGGWRYRGGGTAARGTAARGPGGRRRSSRLHNY